MKLNCHSIKHTLLSVLSITLLTTSSWGITFTWEALSGNWQSTNVGGTGNSNWNTNGAGATDFPDDAADDAVFNQEGTASLTGSVSINNLSLNAANATLTIGNSNVSLTAAGDVNNSGTINLTTNSSFRTASLIVGGTFNNTGNLTFQTGSGSGSVRNLEATTINDGTVTAENNTSVSFSKDNGIFTNNGITNLNTGSRFGFSGNTTFTQAGGTVNNQGALNITSGATLSLTGGDITGNAVFVENANINFGAGSSSSQADFTVRRTSSWVGNIGSAIKILIEAASNNTTFSTNADVINAGSIEVTSVSSFRTATLSVGANNTLTNTGSITFLNGTGSSHVFTGSLNNQGQVTFKSGHTTSFNTSEAVHTNSGTLTLESGSALSISGLIGEVERFRNEAGGRIEGSGSLLIVQTDLANAGTIAPGNSAGELSVSGGIIFESTAALEIEIGGFTAGTEHDLLDVTGSIILDGALNVSFLDNFYEDISFLHTLTIVESGDIHGNFSNLSPDNRVNTTDGFGSFLVTVNLTNIRLSEFIASTVPEPSTYAMLTALGALLFTIHRKRAKASKS